MMNSTNANMDRELKILPLVAGAYAAGLVGFTCSGVPSTPSACYANGQYVGSSCGLTAENQVLFCLLIFQIQKDTFNLLKLCSNRGFVKSCLQNTGLSCQQVS